MGLWVYNKEVNSDGKLNLQDQFMQTMVDFSYGYTHVEVVNNCLQ